MLTGNGNPVTRQLGPSTRVVETGLYTQLALFAVAAGASYELINGRTLPRAVDVNPVHAVHLRQRREINPPTVTSTVTEHGNLTAATTATTSTTSTSRPTSTTSTRLTSANYSTKGVAEVTSSSRDMTSSVSLQSDRPTIRPTTMPPLQTTTQNTSSLNVTMVSFMVLLLSFRYVSSLVSKPKPKTAVIVSYVNCKML